MKSVWQWTLLWPVIINKTIMQQNRVKSLHHNGDSLEQKRSSNIPGRLRQSPAQLAQELKSISVDWDKIGTKSPCDESPTYLAIL